MAGDAPGRPGIEPRWTSSAKQAIGTARTAASPVWFALSHGILNEVYFPRIDRACLRDAEFLVVDRNGRVFEEKRDGLHTTEMIDELVPAFTVRTGSPDGAFTITKRFVTDPHRPTLLIDVAFVADEPLDTFTLVFLAAPHIANHGAGNTAWVGDYKGRPVVYASRESTTLAVATSAPLLGKSVGYVGVSDAWHQVQTDGAITQQWRRAEDGNVAIALQPDLAACSGRFTIALGFGTTDAEAGHQAVAALEAGFDSSLGAYHEAWTSWTTKLRLPRNDDALARTSSLVLATHEAQTFPGGLIASLSIPWGFSRGDGDLGGYHLVWPRDHAEAAGAFFAIDAFDDGLRALSYLRTTQEADGHWGQNMWLDGTPYWHGVQLDETALPVLLVGLARDVGALASAAGYWPMVRAAAQYLVRNGPVTAQDRWEEDGGYSPFTLATEISALLTAADLAEEVGEADVATYLRETADCWDGHIERWCHVSGTELAASTGVDGYYVRIAPPDSADAATPLEGWIPIKNRPPGQEREPARSIVSPDALALVRYGLRAADDPRILQTIRVIDATLSHHFDYGTGWRRYTDDGYGEHEDGSPFDGTGRGRVWPLLTGERAHYEVAAGNADGAADLAATMRAMAGTGNLLPEQTWDAPDIPSRELWHGRPAGSAMPLVWAHAEYLKLLRSIDDGAVFDTPSSVRLHTRDAASARRRFWRTNHKVQQIGSGSTLRIELLDPAVVHWSVDEWASADDTPTVDTGIGMHIVDIDAGLLAPGTELVFTMKWADGWEHNDYRVRIGES